MWNRRSTYTSQSIWVPCCCIHVLQNKRHCMESGQIAICLHWNVEESPAFGFEYKCAPYQISVHMKCHFACRCLFNWDVLGGRIILGSSRSQLLNLEHSLKLQFVEIGTAVGIFLNEASDSSDTSTAGSLSGLTILSCLLARICILKGVGRNIAES